MCVYLLLFARARCAGAMFPFMSRVFGKAKPEYFGWLSHSTFGYQSSFKPTFKPKNSSTHYYLSCIFSGSQATIFLSK